MTKNLNNLPRLSLNIADMCSSALLEIGKAAIGNDKKKVTILETGTYDDIKVFDEENEEYFLLTEFIDGEHFQVSATTGRD